VRSSVSWLADAAGHRDCCSAQACTDAGCTVGLPRLKGRVCISGTLYRARHGHAQRLCDCLVLGRAGDRNVGLVVELKGGRVPASTAIEQLREGAVLLDKLSKACASMEFGAVLAHGGRIRTMEVRMLRGATVKFRGANYPIVLRRCGNAL
jgi:hypothetical protein